MNRKQLTALALIAAALSVGCTKTDDAPKPVDDSAAGRAAAAISASSAPLNATDKANADLAKIRDIKEKEQADNHASKRRGDSISSDMVKGASKPLRDLKY
jgi:hypothetical protein